MQPQTLAMGGMESHGVQDTTGMSEQTTHTSHSGERQQLSIGARGDSERVGGIGGFPQTESTANKVAFSQWSPHLNTSHSSVAPLSEHRAAKI